MQPGPPPRITILALLVAGTNFMENLDATAITPAVPQMARSFAVRPVDLNSGVSAYMLTLGIFMPISGWMAERFGARRVFGLAIALFTLASLLCGLARGLDEFVLLRILQGIGGAMMTPVGRLVVLRVTPKARLIDIFAWLVWPALVAPVLGPPLGGLLVEHGGWRWIFFLNLPLGAVAFGLVWWLVPDTRGPHPARFDRWGFLLSGLALVCLLTMAELFSRALIPWREVAGLALAGSVLLAAALLHMRNHEAPLLDLSVLRVKSFAVTILGGGLFRMSVGAVPFLLPVMFQIGLGYDAFTAGTLLMAVFAGNLLIKPATTPILRRFGFRGVLIVNGLLNALALACCAGLGRFMPLPVICAILFLGGATRSMQFTALNTIAFADVPQARMAGANTLFSTAAQLAMGLGVAVGGIAWRLGEAVAPAGPAWPFRIAFLVVALLALLGVLDCLSLPRGVGANVTKGKPAKG